MNKLERVYLGICIAVTGLFGMGVHNGWKAPPPFSPNPGGSYYGSSGRGVYHPVGGGFRASGGSWGGGK
jgi:hypothetical protein